MCPQAPSSPSSTTTSRTRHMPGSWWTLQRVFEVSMRSALPQMHSTSTSVLVCTFAWWIWAERQLTFWRAAIAQNGWLLLLPLEGGLSMTLQNRAVNGLRRNWRTKALRQQGTWLSPAHTSTSARTYRSSAQSLFKQLSWASLSWHVSPRRTSQSWPKGWSTTSALTVWTKMRSSSWCRSCGRLWVTTKPMSDTT